MYGHIGPGRQTQAYPTARELAAALGGHKSLVAGRRAVPLTTATIQVFRSPRIATAACCGLVLWAVAKDVLAALKTCGLWPDRYRRPPPCWSSPMTVDAGANYLRRRNGHSVLGCGRGPQMAIEARSATDASIPANGTPAALNRAWQFDGRSRRMGSLLGKCPRRRHPARWHNRLERALRRWGWQNRNCPCPCCGGTDRFSINVKKRICSCSGCGLKGDVIAFVDGCYPLVFGARTTPGDRHRPPGLARSEGRGDHAQGSQRRAGAARRFHPSISRRSSATAPCASISMARQSSR